MPDYDQYARTAGVTRTAIIKELHRQYPRYGKATHAMVCAPEKYAVQLIPEAEALLRETFGDAPGLSEASVGVEPPKPRRKENRTKGNKLTVRLDDSLFSQLRDFYGRTCFASMQDMVEAAIVEFLNKRNV